MKAADKTVAPSFKLLTASSYDWTFQWIEYINGDAAGLGTAAILPAADTGPSFLGAYTVANGEVFLNPQTGTLTSNTAWPNYVPNIEVANAAPSIYIPGSVGNFIYHPIYEGPFQLTQTNTIESSVVMS